MGHHGRPEVTDGRLDLRLLGPVRARQDGEELDLGSTRRTAVLAVLAMQAGRPVSREQLVAAVWGDAAPASAMANVYTCVSDLRAVLGSGRGRKRGQDILTSGGGSYCLHVDAEDVDVFRFEALRERSHRQRSAGDRAAELADLAAALGLWRGEALTGVPGPYASAQRTRLTELWLATVERHAVLLVELDRRDEAIDALRPVVQAHPVQENLRRLLVTALEGAGRRDAATGLWWQNDRARAAAADLPPTRTAERARIDDDADVTIVGREAELRRLRAAVADAAAGRGGSVWVTGSCGIGKSALLHAALDRAPAGCRVGLGVADDLARRTPLGVLLECVETALAGDATHHLAQQLFAVAGNALDSHEHQTVERAVAVIREAATAGPLVLALDGLDGADPASLRTWVELHRLTGELPLLLIGAGVPASDDTRSELLRVAAVEEIALPPLSPGESAVLVRAVAAEPPEPEELRGILRDAGGNPYYLRHLATANKAADRRLEPSSELVAAVTAHLDRFSDVTRQALRAVAFLCVQAFGADRPECTFEEVAAVTGRPVHELRQALASAVTAGLLDGSGDRLRFRHRIVERVLREGTPKALRNMVHRSFAEQLASTGSRPERVAGQLLAGSVPLTGWVSGWVMSQVEELGKSSPEAAIALLRLAWGRDALERESQLMLTAWLVRLLFQQGHNAAAEGNWVAARTDDVQLEAEMRWIVAATHSRFGDYCAAGDVVRAVLSEQRLPRHWLDRFRALLSELRPHLPGEPTAVRARRMVLDDGLSVAS